MHDQYSTKVLIFLPSICTLFFVNKWRAERPDIGVTASLGYVLHPDFGDDVAVLAGLADKALMRQSTMARIRQWNIGKE